MLHQAELNEKSHLINQDNKYSIIEIDQDNKDSIIDIERPYNYNLERFYNSNLDLESSDDFRLIEGLPNENIQVYVFSHLRNVDLVHFSRVSWMAYDMVNQTVCAELTKQWQDLEKPSCLTGAFVKSMTPAKIIIGAGAITFAAGFGVGLSAVTNAVAVATGMFNATNTSFVNNVALDASFCALSTFPPLVTNVVTRLDSFPVLASAAAFETVLKLIFSDKVPIGNIVGNMVYATIAKDFATIASGTTIGLLAKEGLKRFGLWGEEIEKEYNSKVNEEDGILQKFKGSSQEMKQVI